MKFKSAPTPWYYAGGGVIEDANDNSAIYLAGRLNDGTADDVGLVIAAAPDLHEALKALLHECVEAGFATAEDYGWPAAVAGARAALAKAKGVIP